MATKTHDDAPPAEVTAEGLAAIEAAKLTAKARRERILHNLARVAVLILFIGVWELLSRRYNPTLLPSPLETWEGLERGWILIRGATVDTIIAIAYGFGVGAFFGISLGSLLGQSRTSEGVLHPFLVVYQSVPKVGLAPILLLLLGTGVMPKVALAAMSSFFPMLENTIVGVQRVDPDSLRLFRGLGAHPLKIFYKLRLITALPYVLTGIRIGVVFATVSVVVAELVAGRIGLGSVIVVAYAENDSPLVYAAILGITVVGLAYYSLAVVIDFLVLRWFNLQAPSN